MRPCVAWLLAGATLAAGCGGSPATGSGPRLDLDAPVELELVPHLVPVVVATVDGRPGLSFLVDTGSDGSSVNLRLVREHGFEIQPLTKRLSRVASDGRSVEFDGYVWMQRIELGELLIEDLHAAAIESEVSMRDWFGVLGQDVLGQLIVILDAERGRLHALPASTDEESLSAYLRDANLGPGEWKLSRAAFQPSPRLALKAAALEGGELELVIDTGATHTGLPTPAIAALGLEELGTYTAESSSGRHEGKTYRLENLDFQGRSVSAEITDCGLPFGLLGMDILSEFVVVLDAPRGQVWFHHRETH